MNINALRKCFCLTALPPLLWMTFGTGVADAAEYLFIPSLSLEEELTDNVHGGPNKRSDLITHVMPAFTFSYNSTYIDFSSSATFDYRHYLNNSMVDKFDFQENSGIGAKFNYNGKYIGLDLSERLARTYLEPLRNMGNEGTASPSTLQNTVSGSPYIKLNPGGKLSAQTGYKFDYVTSLDNAPTNDTYTHNVYLRPAYQILPRFKLTAELSATRTESGSDNTEDSLLSTLGFIYDFASNSQFTLTGGHTVREIKGVTSHDPYWDINLTYNTGRISTVLQTSTKYNLSTTDIFTETWKSSANVTGQLDMGSIGGTAEFSRLTDSTKDSIISDLMTYKITGSRTFTKDLNATFNLNLDKMTSYGTTDPYPYRYGLDASLNYALSRRFDLKFAYYYTRYASLLGFAADGYDINRLLATLTLKFDGIAAKQLPLPGGELAKR